MRAPHQDARLVLLVAVGGAVGTAARYLVSGAVRPADSGFPIATLVENVVGALLLGLLAETLVRRGAESTRGRVLRLGLGTGALGGFTTFSSLAIELERLLAGGAAAVAGLYAVTSLTLGLAAALGGIALGARLARPRRAAPSSGTP